MNHSIGDTPKPRFPWKLILMTAALAGSLDILAAFINSYAAGGRSPMIVLRFIASGVWGHQAFSGDATMVLWGLLFHFIIALIWTVIYFIGYFRVIRFIRNWFAAGLFYGVVVWIFMSRVVLPMSNVPLIPFDPLRALLAIAILMVCIGLPISFMAHRYYRDK